MQRENYNTHCQPSCYFNSFSIASAIWFCSNNLARIHHFIVFRRQNCFLLQTFIPFIEHSLRNTLILYVFRSIAQTLSSQNEQRMWHFSLTQRASLISWRVKSPRDQTQSNVRINNIYVNMTTSNYHGPCLSKNMHVQQTNHH